MKAKFCSALLAIAAVLWSGLFLPSRAVHAGEGDIITMQIVAVNPKKSERNTIDIKSYLPLGLRRDDIVETGIFELKYDSRVSLFYVEKIGVKLAPGRIRKFPVEMKDVWFIHDDSLDALKSRAELALSQLQGSRFFDIAEKIVARVVKGLDDIRTFQRNPTVPKRDYIANYPRNVEKLKQMREDVETLESYVVQLTAPDDPDILKKKDLAMKPPSITMTWLLIFIILTFVGILTAVFFFVWHRRERSLEDTAGGGQGPSFGGSEEDDEPGE